MRGTRRQTPEARAKISAKQLLRWERVRRDEVLSDRYYVASTSGFPMESPARVQPLTEWSVHDGAVADREIKRFRGPHGSRDALAHCRKLNRDEARWEADL